MLQQGPQQQTLQGNGACCYIAAIFWVLLKKPLLIKNLTVKLCSSKHTLFSLYHPSAPGKGSGFPLSPQSSCSAGIHDQTGENLKAIS